MTIPACALTAIDQGLALLPAVMDSESARVMLLAIGLQESGLTTRVQIVDGGGQGPARGLWQFERGGGAAGVLRHNASRFWMHRLCTEHGVEPTPSGLWGALATDDALAAAAARLLLFTDPKRLPALGDIEGAWALYLRVWQPGKPHRSRWASNYPEACGALAAEAA